MARYYRRRYYRRSYRRPSYRRFYSSSRGVMKSKVTKWVLIILALLGVSFLFIPSVANWFKSKLGLKTA